MPFESLGAVSYSPSIVTVAVSVTVCEIFSVKKWRDLKNQVRVSSYKLGILTHFLEIPSPGKSPASWVKAKLRVVMKRNLALNETLWYL